MYATHKSNVALYPTFQEVAKELSISEITVRLHRSRAMRKLREKSVARLAWMAHVLDMRG